MDPVLSMNPRLYEAAKSGNVAGLPQLLREICDLYKEVTPLKNTVLHVAVQFGQMKFVEEVCKRCPRLLTQANMDEDTPLHIAARFGNRDIADFIISQIKATYTSLSNDTENGATGAIEKFRVGNKDNYTPLHEAVGNDHFEVAKLLIEADPDLSYFDGNAKPSLLYLAARTGSNEIVKLILQNPPASALGGSEGQTAMHVAAASPKLDIVEALLEKKPQLVKVADNDGRTPLHYAAHFGRKKVVKKLIGIDKSSAYQRDKVGRSPLHVAAFKARIGVLQELTRNCPDCVDLLSSDGRSALHLAVMSGSIITVAYALDVMDLERFVNLRDNDGNTPLHLAAKQVQPLIFFHLSLHNKAHKWAKNKSGQTALDIHFLTAESSTINLKIWSLFIKFIYRHRRKQDMREQITIPKKENDENSTINLYREMGNTLATVATLIATVTFASALQVPGGFVSEGGSNKGVAVLSADPYFQNFIVADTIALSLSLIAMFLVLFGTYFNNKLFIYFFEFARILTYIAFLATGLAFMAGVAAVLPAGSLKSIVNQANFYAPYIFASIGLSFFAGPLFGGFIVISYQMTPLHLRRFNLYFLIHLRRYARCIFLFKDTSY